MTTICVVRKGGMAAIACDTCTNWGSTLDTARYVANHSKIISVGDAFIAISGPTGAKLAAGKYFRSLQDIEFTGVESIYDTWLELHEFFRESCFLRPEDDHDDEFETSGIDALIACRAGIFGVSRQRAVQEFTRFYAYGRGNEYAMGAMFARYDDPLATAQMIAEIGVTAGAEFEESTNLPLIVHLVDVTEG